MYREQRSSCFLLDHIASQPLPSIKRVSSTSETRWEVQVWLLWSACGFRATVQPSIPSVMQCAGDCRV